MGKYDALEAYGTEAAPAAPAGKYAALEAFGEPASEQPMRVGGRPAGLDEPFVVQGSPAARDADRQRYDAIERMKRNYNLGIEALGKGIQSPVETIKNPSRRREFERGLSDVVTLGLAEKAARLVDPQAFGREQAAKDAAAEPGFRVLGGMTGSFLPSPASVVARGATKLIPGAGVVPGAARGLVTYEATAPAAAAIAAEPGKRLDAAIGAATDPAGLITAAGAGAAIPVLNLPSGAAARTRTAAKQGITTGEQNAGKRLTEKFRAAGGGDDQFVDDLFKRHPGLETIAAIKGKTNPGAVAESVNKHLADKGKQLDSLYADMVKAKRPVTPQDIDASFAKQIDDAIEAGDRPTLNVLRQERAEFMRDYGSKGALSPDTMRGLKGSAGKVAYGGAPAPNEAKAAVWRTYADAIEQQAKGSGVNVDKLRQLNKDTQILMAAKKSLDEREVMRRAGRKSIGEHVSEGAMAASGDTGALKAKFGIPVLRTVGEAARTVDAGLARIPGLERLRLPEMPNRTAAIGARLGQTLSAPPVPNYAGARPESPEYAGRVLRGLDEGKSLEEAMKAAGDE